MPGVRACWAQCAWAVYRKEVMRHGLSQNCLEHLFTIQNHELPQTWSVRPELVPG